MYIQLHTIKHINRQFVVLHTCTQTLFHTRHSTDIHKKSLDAPNNKRQYVIEPFLIRSVRCLQTRAFLTIVSVQSARFISFNHSCRLFSFLSGSGSSVKMSIFQNSDFILAIPRLYLTIMIRKINWSFSLLSYIPHIWLSPPQNGQTRYCWVKSSYKVRNTKYEVAFARKKKSQKRIVRQNS